MKFDRVFERSGLKGTFVIHTVSEWDHSWATDQYGEIHGILDQAFSDLGEKLKESRARWEEKRGAKTR